MILIAAGACQSGIEPIGATESVPVRLIYQNQQCQSDISRIESIQDVAALTRWWQPFARQQLPAKPLPPELAAIDFDQLTAFIVSMGSQPTAGYGIELHADQAPVQGATLTIPATWKEPAPDMMVAQIMSSPCVVITVPVKRYETVAVRDQQGDTLVETQLPPE